MAYTPNTDLKILDCPLDSSNKNQFTWSSQTAQFNYFNGRPCYTKDSISTFEKFQYLRKDDVILFPAHIDDIRQYNYVMYKNKNYDNKWFYAYITKMEYENNNVTRIYIKTDVFQTWYFQIVYARSFVEREHVSSDIIGQHTVPEGLETGEFTCNEIVKSDLIDPEHCHAVLISSVSPKTLETEGSTLYGQQNGVGYYLAGSYIDDDGRSVLAEMIYRLTAGQKAEAIQGLILVPDFITGYDSIQTWDYLITSGGLSYYPFKKIEFSSKGVPPVRTITTSKQTNVNGYIPRNNKVLCYPFNYLLASNNNGSSAIYHYEDFNSSNVGFNVRGIMSPGCSIRMQPTNYKGINENNEYGLNYGKLPILNYNVDLYTAYINTNSINMGSLNFTTDDLNVASSMVGSLFNIVGQTASGNLGGFTSGMINGLGSISNAVGEQIRHEKIPPQTKGNINSTDINFQNKNGDISLYKMSIKAEYARIIDNYFDLYGYKINRVKFPNITGRRNWNFVKTIEANIQGPIPDDDIEEIKSYLNAGITFWHNTATYLDYSQDNSII